MLVSRINTETGCCVIFWSSAELEVVRVRAGGVVGTVGWHGWFLTLPLNTVLVVYSGVPV